MSGAAVALFGVGGAFEFFGIVALVWPDLIPYRDRLAAWMSATGARIAGWARRLLRRPVPHRDVTTPITTPVGRTVDLRWNVLAKKSSSPDATLEEKVAFPLQRDQEAQHDVGTLASRVDELAESTSKGLDDVRTELKEHVSVSLVEERERYRPLRAAGAIALAIGLFCSVFANFV